MMVRPRFSIGTYGDKKNDTKRRSSVLVICNINSDINYLLNFLNEFFEKNIVRRNMRNDSSGKMSFILLSRKLFGIALC